MVNWRPRTQEVQGMHRLGRHAGVRIIPSVATLVSLRALA